MTNRRTFNKGIISTGVLSLAAAHGNVALGKGNPEQKGSSNRGKAKNTCFAVNVEMWFGSLGFLDRVRASADLGFPAIEFWPYEGKPLDELAKLTQQLKIEITQFTAWGFGSELNDPKADHARFVKTIEESCDVADRLHCQLFTVVLGNNIPGYTKEQMHNAAIEGLKRAAEFCEKRDKVMIIEPMNPRNHPNHSLYGSRDAIAICQAVGSKSVKINWDLYHMQIVEGDLCMRLREGWDHVGYLQLADNPGRHEPGTGEVQYRRVLQEIQSLGYTGSVGLECVPRDGEEQAAERVFAADAF
jgi:hydroxypyruvate isomerase